MAPRKSPVKDRTDKGKDGVSVTMTVINTLALVLTVVIFVKMAIIQTTFKVDPAIVKYFKAMDQEQTENPSRGNIH